MGSGRCRHREVDGSVLSLTAKAQQSRRCPALRDVESGPEVRTVPGTVRTSGPDSPSSVPPKRLGERIVLKACEKQLQVRREVFILSATSEDIKMRTLFASALLIGLSTVGWSDTFFVNMDQSMSAPIELAFFNLNLSPVIPVNVMVTYTDLDTSPFLARLAVNQGSGWNLGAVGMCDILVNPGSTSGNCTATGGFLPGNTDFHVGFEMFDPNAPTHQLGDPTSAPNAGCVSDPTKSCFWHVADITVSASTNTAVPEPSTLSLLFVVLGITVWGVRRHRLS